MMSQPNMDSVAALPNATSIPAPKSKQKNKPQLIRYRLMILYRFLLAGIGGYALSALAAVVIAQVFTESRSSAAMTATLVAFSLHTCTFIWVFMVHKTLKATFGIVLPMLVLAIIYKMLGN